MIAGMSDMGTLPGRPSGSSTASGYRKGKGDAEEICSKVTQQDGDRAGTGTVLLGSSSQFIPLPQYTHGLPRSVLFHAETHTFINKSKLPRLPDAFCDRMFFAIGILTSMTKLCHTIPEKCVDLLM